MTMSFLIRVVEEALRSGRIAGQIEVVASGETATFRDIAELVAFLMTNQADERAT